MKFTNIAIDGPSGAGKSTLARLISERLGYLYIDTGAMYRAAALKMITDIERFGDQASDIGDIVYTMPGDRYIKKLEHITAMGNLAMKMVRESVNSFIENNEPLADEVIALDDKMDELFLTVKNELIELIKQDGANGDQAIELMMVAKYLERIGDHAVNVAEWTKFNETGVHEKF